MGWVRNFSKKFLKVRVRSNMLFIRTSRWLFVDRCQTYLSKHLKIEKGITKLGLVHQTKFHHTVKALTCGALTLQTLFNLCKRSVISFQPAEFKMKTENSRRQTTLTDQISEPESFSPMIKSFEKKSNSRSCKFFILSHLRNCEKNT